MPAPGITKKIVKKHVSLSKAQREDLMQGIREDMKARQILYQNNPLQFTGVPDALIKLQELHLLIGKAKGIVVFQEKP